MPKTAKASRITSCPTANNYFQISTLVYFEPTKPRTRQQLPPEKVWSNSSGRVSQFSTAMLQSIGLHRSSWIHSIQASFLVSTATVASGNRRRSWQQKVAFGESRKVKYTLRNRLFKMSVLRKRGVCIIHCSRKRT